MNFETTYFCLDLLVRPEKMSQIIVFGNKLVLFSGMYTLRIVGRDRCSKSSKNNFCRKMKGTRKNKRWGDGYNRDFCEVGEIIEKDKEVRDLRKLKTWVAYLK